MKNTRKMISVARGYQEMGQLNLSITQEFFQLENEGEKIFYEMDKKKANGEAK